MSVTAFFEDSVVAQGDREAVTRVIEERWPASDHGRILVFEDESGRLTDLPYWSVGAKAEAQPQKRSRGRPSLGVVAREVTLLPRQWEWLSAQPGGASAALRRLVEEARKAPPSPEARRDAAHRFMSHLCGDRPGYEEALRSLYRGDWERFDALIAAWPEDVRCYIARLLEP